MCRDGRGCAASRAVRAPWLVSATAMLLVSTPACLTTDQRFKSSDGQSSGDSSSAEGSQSDRESATRRDPQLEGSAGGSGSGDTAQSDSTEGGIHTLNDSRTSGASEVTSGGSMDSFDSEPTSGQGTDTADSSSTDTTSDTDSESESTSDPDTTGSASDDESATGESTDTSTNDTDAGSTSTDSGAEADSDSSSETGSATTGEIQPIDLVPMNMVLGGGAMAGGAEVSLSIDIWNLGSEPCNEPAWRVEFGEQFEEGRIFAMYPVNPGSYIYLGNGLPFERSGRQTVTFIIDPDNEINELDETNNRISMEIDVGR